MTIEQDASVLATVQALFASGATGGLPDAELLERFLARNDATAFEALVVRHGPMVLDVCRNVLRDRHDADDAFQATFLVLARKAGAIRRRDSLASWLFGVAGRVAARARAEIARRRLHERKAAERGALGQVREDAGQDVDLSALHEEIARLPERYREPVVLCYLEDMTHEAAAETLGCPVGTVSVRLMRAREKLQARLSRRGRLVPGGLPAAGGLPKTAVPPLLVQSTARAVLVFSSGKPMPAGTIPASVLALTQGVLKSMVLTKLKVIVLGALPVLLLGVGGGVLVGQQETPTPGQGPRNPPGKTSGALPKKTPIDTIEIFRVDEPPGGVDPDAAVRKHLVDAARRRREAQRTFYEQGRITLDRYLDALTQVKDAEVRAAATRDEKIAAVADYLARVKEVEKRERRELDLGRSTSSDVEEAALRRELAEMELRQAGKPSGPLDLNSLDQRLSALERRLDLILKMLSTARPPGR